MQNDLTFFTNEPGSALLDRFKRTLRDVKFFDILVGYFRTSGFDKLHKSFATIDKIRILVGIPQWCVSIACDDEIGVIYDPQNMVVDGFETVVRAFQGKGNILPPIPITPPTERTTYRILPVFTSIAKSPILPRFSWFWLRTSRASPTAGA